MRIFFCESPVRDRRNTVNQSISITRSSSALQRGKTFFWLAFAFVTAITTGCKDPDELGLEVLPEADLINMVLTDTATVVSTTVREDSLRADEVSVQLLGFMNDPTFGKATASVFTQVVLEGLPQFGVNPVADSLVLSLAYSGSYGDTNAVQTVSVYRVTEDLYTDSNYYSYQTFAYEPAALGTLQFAPRPVTRVTVGSDTNAIPQIRIPLSQAIADSILLLNNQPQLASNDNWKSYFKGLYIHPEDMSLTTGAISYLNFFNSKLILYYRDSSNTAKSYSFSLTGARLNNFSHDFTGTNAGGQLADPAYADSLNYILSMSGLKTRISLPYLKHFTDSGSIVVNKAELEIRIKPDINTLEYPLPQNLLLVTTNESGTSVYPVDFFETGGAYGGLINNEEGKYTFNIARHIQGILDGRYAHSDMFLVISGSSVLANRVIIGSGKNSSYPLKLKVYYTPIN